MIFNQAVHRSTSHITKCQSAFRKSLLQYLSEMEGYGACEANRERMNSRIANKITLCKFGEFFQNKGVDIRIPKIILQKRHEGRQEFIRSRFFIDFV